MTKKRELSWNDLFLNGSVIHLHTSRWMARLKIKPADLGIDDTDAVAKALRLGSHRLAPKEAFQQIDEQIQKARRIIDNNSMAFGFIWGARYIPEKNLEAVSEQLNETRDAFQEAVADFLADYDKTKAEMLPVLRKALKEAAKTEEAADQAFERVLTEYPVRTEVERKFALSWDVYVIGGARDSATAAAIRTEGETVKSAVKVMMGNLREEMSGKIASIVELINKGGKLKPQSIESARAVLDHLDRVNVLGDQVLADQVGNLRILLMRIEQSNGRIPDAQVTGLQDIKEALEADLEGAVKAAERKLTGGRRKLSAA